MRSVFSWLLAACLLLVAGADALGARFAGELPQPDSIHRLAVEEAERYPDGLPFDPKFEYRRALLEQAGFSILAGDSDSKVLHALLLKEFFPNELQTPVLGYKGEHAKGSLRHHTAQARQILWSNETRYLPEHEAVELASHLVKLAETSSYVTTNALQRKRQIMEGIMMVPEGLILAAGWTPAGRGVAVPKQVATRATGTRGAGTLTKMMTRGAARTGAAEQGGLNLFKWNHPTSTRATGWKEGDRFLYLPNQGSAQANWVQNSSRLRAEMRSGRPIYETFVDDVGNLLPTRGFLNAERNLLLNRGWTYNPATRAWTPPTP